MALIDPSAVRRLLGAQLNTVAGGVVALFEGDADPAPDAAVGGGDGVSRWSRLVSLVLTPMPRVRSNSGVSSGEAQHADFVCAINCGASVEDSDSGGSGSDLAITQVLGEVVLVMAEQCLRDAATGHDVDVLSAEVRVDAEPDGGGQRKVRTGAVILTGVASRMSGAGMESH